MPPEPNKSAGEGSSSTRDPSPLEEHDTRIRHSAPAWRMRRPRKAPGCSTCTWLPALRAPAHPCNQAERIWSTKVAPSPFRFRRQNPRRLGKRRSHVRNVRDPRPVDVGQVCVRNGLARRASSSSVPGLPFTGSVQPRAQHDSLENLTCACLGQRIRGFTPLQDSMPPTILRLVSNRSAQAAAKPACRQPIAPRRSGVAELQ